MADGPSRKSEVCCSTNHGCAMQPKFASDGSHSLGGIEPQFGQATYLFRRHLMSRRAVSPVQERSLMPDPRHGEVVVVDAVG